MNPISLVGHAIELLQLIENSRQPADRTASAFFRERKYLGSKDRRFISESVYGIIRHRRYAEALLEQYLSEHPAHAELDDRHHRFLALYTVYAASVAPPENAIPTPGSLWKTTFPSIELAPFVGWTAAHASLAYLDVDDLVRLGVKYSFQDWMVDEWSSQVGDQVEQLLQALNSPPNISLRVNLLKTTREECRERLLREGIETAQTPLSPAGLISKKRFSVQSSPTFKDGWFEMQDEGSQLVALIANPQPNGIVIDACAGAGGKSLHLAELMKDTGEIIAIDVERKRLFELQTRALRAGVHSIRTQLREELQPGNLAGKADLVLVDAPCSGVGTIRRNPGMKWSVTESLVAHFAEKQREILAFSSGFVRPGGRLIYVTCSLFRQENDGVVEAFLAANTNFGLVPPPAGPPGHGLSADPGNIRLFPHVHNTDGFFIASMERTDN